MALRKLSLAISSGRETAAVQNRLSGAALGLGLNQTRLAPCSRVSCEERHLLERDASDYFLFILIISALTEDTQMRRHGLRLTAAMLQRVELGENL